MRFERVRLAIRLLIAASTLMLGLYPIIAEERERRAGEELRSLAKYHASKTVDWIGCSRYTRCIYVDRSGKVMTGADVQASGWHQQLASKYWEATRHPWLHIEPDSPPP